MNQPQWQPAPSPGAGRTVRRARDSIGSLPPEAQQRSAEQSRALPNQGGNRKKPPNGQGQAGAAISRPMPVPQWPLSESGSEVRNNQYQPPAGREMPPRRPPRPSRVPSILDSSKTQDHIPSFPYKAPQRPPPQRPSPPEQHEGRDAYREEDPQSPTTASSRPSTVSSVGTIPDFPVPMPSSGPPQSLPPGSQRRSVNLGPPPSARRGISYYSQPSFVSPIPEESPRSGPSHRSYASSAAMPSNWEPESSGYRSDEFDDYEGTEKSSASTVDGLESRESNLDDSDERGLIRSASLGKRAKPSVVMTKSSDRVAQLESAKDGSRPSQPPATQRSPAPLAIINEKESQRQTVWPSMGNPDSPLASGTGLITDSSSESSTPKATKAELSYAAAPDSMPEANHMLEAYNAASATHSRPSLARTPSPGFNRLSAIRRPPRLDIEAVRDAESRGSMTSLPDLIRRATKLAAMMERGRRPASRINDLHHFPSEIDMAAREKGTPSSVENRQSGFTDMLSAFPPPGLGTPREGTPRPVSHWPAQPASTEDGNGEKQSKSGKRGRRCCGLPCWGFLLLILLLLIIVAAAIVVPLELLVFRKERNQPSPPSALQQCQDDPVTACQNGAVTSTATGSCSCICVNGFSGSTCDVQDRGACATINLDGSVTNATLGNAIPRLISSSQRNFSIPLSEDILVARLNSGDLSCISQNALVTFDGRSVRLGGSNQEVVPTPSEASNPLITPTSSHHSSEKSKTSSATKPPAATNGMPTDHPHVHTPTPTSRRAPEPSGGFTVTEEVVDFARIGVLFVLQEENLDSAVNAQDSLQRFFDLKSYANSAALNVSLGGGNTINLEDFTLDIGNGTIGRNASQASNSNSRSRRSFRSIAD